ncbi:SRPBCC family protein [Tessaracoccus antarcticus]|uniref:SRPBCC family protein n=1 Tax=Tessaracoccus antarcticus TaxID=2479848 RepID=A0A3M0GBJ3_9ACTN|nr:SRPBCC family protein [Tessaracoccus antarcticus]RMB58419.1 SRPBCC family protein [Tessaracoccus antarcticus]
MGTPRRRRTPLYVEVEIQAPLERVWELTQDTDAHPRWDLRFSRITPVEELPAGGYRFVYERSLPFHTLKGVGVSVGERSRPDGSRTSALKFATDDRLSPMGEGRGYWRYVPTATGTRFITGYDYEPGFGAVGALMDRLVTRRLIGWMTALSFDRLRMWAETGEEPGRWPVVSTFMLWRSQRPRAARCLRRPPTRDASVMDDAPATLEGLETP